MKRLNSWSSLNVHTPWNHALKLLFSDVKENSTDFDPKCVGKLFQQFKRIFFSFFLSMWKNDSFLGLIISYDTEWWWPKNLLEEIRFLKPCYSSFQAKNKQWRHKQSSPISRIRIFGHSCLQVLSVLLIQFPQWSSTVTKQQKNLSLIDLYVFE